MLATVHTLGVKSLTNTLTTVHAGLSGGIPIIKIFGDVSSEYIRNKDIVHFIFSFIGRKLPQKKIRIHFTHPDQKVTLRSVDLSVLISIYLAQHNLIDLNCAALGKVEMDGSVKSCPDCAIFLYIIHISENKPNLIYIPKSEASLAALYPDLNILPIENLIDAIKYLEGDLSATSHSAEKPSKIERNTPPILDIPRIALNRRTTDSIDYFQPHDPNLQAQYETIASKISRLEKLLHLHHLFPQFNDAVLSLDLTQYSIPSHKLLHGSLQKCNQWRVIYSHCLCGGQESGDCYCSTIELHRYRESLNTIFKLADGVIDTSQQQEQIKLLYEAEKYNEISRQIREYKQSMLEIV